MDQKAYEIEQEKLKILQEKEKERLNENKLKQIEEKRKQEEYKFMIQSMLEESRKKAEIKNKILEEKNYQRKILLEKKHLQKIEENKKKSEIKQEKIMYNMKNLELKINYQKQKLMEKQKLNEEKKLNFENLRELAFKERQDKNAKKSEKIQKVLLNNELHEKQRLYEYKEKQDLIYYRKMELEEMQNEIKKLRGEQNHIKEAEIKEKIFNYYQREEKRKKEIMDKIELKEYRIRYLKEENEREYMEKSEKMTRIRMEKEDKIRRIENLHEYERNIAYKRLMEKDQKLEEFISQKSLILDKKKEMQDYVNKKKKHTLEKFEKIFKKKNIDVINISINIKKYNKIFNNLFFLE
jgi:hypothetical protein